MQGAVNLGPLGNRQVLDTPLSTVVISHDLVVNQQSRSIADLVRYLPSTQLEIRGDPSTSRLQSRGFEDSIISNTRIDGLNAIATTPYPAEWIDDLQVLNGLSAALYGPHGPQNPAGTFNYILKRPTDHERNRLMAGVDSIGTLMENADMSGRHKCATAHHEWLGPSITLWRRIFIHTSDECDV